MRTDQTDITASPDIESYLRVHRALRASAAQLAQATARPADDSKREARRRWYDGFADEIQCHHHIEDELLFPAIAARVATYPEIAPKLEGDHADLDVLLDDLRAALATGDDPRAATLAAELRDHLDEHLTFEDHEIAPLFVRHFSPAEYDELNARAVRMTSFKQLLFTAPWLMCSLRAARR